MKEVTPERKKTHQPEKDHTSPKLIRHHVIGQICTNGEPLDNVRVTVAGKTARSDKKGIFKLDFQAEKHREYLVHASKPGFFTGSRIIAANHPLKCSKVQIDLIDRSPIASFDNAHGAKIQHDGVTLIFNPWDVVDTNGCPIKGRVNVAIKRIDPTTELGRQQMPGNLVGKSKRNDIVDLVSYVMMAVGLTDTEGNIMKTMRAMTMAIEVPESLQESAPDEIPLWVFNDAIRKWQEENTAILLDTKYAGGIKLDELPFWNCDTMMVRQIRGKSQ